VTVGFGCIVDKLAASGGPRPSGHADDSAWIGGTRVALGGPTPMAPPPLQGFKERSELLVLEGRRRGLLRDSDRIVDAVERDRLARNVARSPACRGRAEIELLAAECPPDRGDLLAGAAHAATEQGRQDQRASRRGSRTFIAGVVRIAFALGVRRGPAPRGGVRRPGGRCSSRRVCGLAARAGPSAGTVHPAPARSLRWQERNEGERGAAPRGARQDLLAQAPRIGRACPAVGGDRARVPLTLQPAAPRRRRRATQGRQELAQAGR
jgi:hypothetical protein